MGRAIRQRRKRLKRKLMSDRIELSKRQRAELNGLNAREREIDREYIRPLREDVLDFFARLEAEQEVKLGETHLLDREGGFLVAVPKPPQEPQCFPSSGAEGNAEGGSREDGETNGEGGSDIEVLPPGPGEQSNEAGAQPSVVE